VDEAIEHLHDAIQADPKQPTAYAQFGAILAAQGRLEEAASNYRLLTRIQPSAAAHQELAQVLLNLGRPDEARKERARTKALERNSSKL
jgi:tetratricopeptide (TPR) repeat protein